MQLARLNIAVAAARLIPLRLRLVIRKLSTKTLGPVGWFRIDALIGQTDTGAKLSLNPTYSGSAKKNGINPRFDHLEGACRTALLMACTREPRSAIAAHWI